MEIFFDWKREELKSFRFIASVLIALTLTLCLSTLVIISFQVSVWLRALIVGGVFLITVLLAARKSLKTMVRWNIVLCIGIELFVCSVMDAVEVWLAVIAVDLFILYMLIRSDLI